jgi:membrane protease YdiL (CAAX protease family)
MTSPDPRPAPARPRPGGAPWAFFLLALALAIPAWVVGARTGIMLLPGLPIAAVSVLAPVLAGLILTWRDGGVADARAFLARAVDVRRIPDWRWCAALLLLPLGIGVATFFALRLAGVAVPAPNISPVTVVSLSALFLVAGTCEELGWSGYAIDPLQARWGPLRASLIVGAVWVVFHYVPLAQAHRSLGWIAWWTLGTLSQRVIMVWLYNRTGRSVAGASLFHASTNLVWQLFPISGSFYDPRFYCPILALVALTLVVGGRAGGPATSRQAP